MQLINATRMQVGYTLGTDPSGREWLVVAIKGTFVLPQPGEPVRLHDEQVPLTLADTFTGAPGFSAPQYEVDFALRKPQCDVLLLGSAHARAGQTTPRTTVQMQVGSVHKSFDVIGPRVWQAGLTGIRASDPQPFAQQPISYDVAFGGVDQASSDPAEHDAYVLNPVGRGFHKQLRNEWVDGTPLPCTEAVGQPVTWPSDAYAPMAFGPVGRGWSQRACYAGTYDQHWRDEVFPFLPANFDERYYQAAPLDQQMPHPTQPVPVRLVNLTPDGLREFALPVFEAPVHVFARAGGREDHLARLDTIVLEPDVARVTMTWRVSRPLQRSLFELAQVLVGKPGAAWWQQREEAAWQPIVVASP